MYALSLFFVNLNNLIVLNLWLQHLQYIYETYSSLYSKDFCVFNKNHIMHNRQSREIDSWSRVFFTCYLKGMKVTYISIDILWYLGVVVWVGHDKIHKDNSTYHWFKLWVGNERKMIHIRTFKQYKIVYSISLIYLLIELK